MKTRCRGVGQLQYSVWQNEQSGWVFVGSDKIVNNRSRGSISTIRSSKDNFFQMFISDQIDP